MTRGIGYWRTREFLLSRVAIDSFKGNVMMSIKVCGKESGR